MIRNHWRRWLRQQTYETQPALALQHPEADPAGPGLKPWKATEQKAWTMCGEQHCWAWACSTPKQTPPGLALRH